MAFKKIESKIGFAELAFSSSMDKNRTLKTLEQMNKVIDWSRIEKILKKSVTSGKAGGLIREPLKAVKKPCAT